MRMCVTLTCYVVGLRNFVILVWMMLQIITSLRADSYINCAVESLQIGSGRAV